MEPAVMTAEPTDARDLASELRDAQDRVLAAYANIEQRNELVRLAAERGWTDRQIQEALGGQDAISTYQVARIRKGMRSGHD